MKLNCIMTLIVGLAASQVASAGNIEAGRVKAEAGDMACVNCHGATGISPASAFPHLAGQHASYLERALHDYRSGRRQEATMNMVAQGDEELGFEPLTDQEIRDLAAFYAAQEGLVTPRLRP
jgi:cytochrome c553